MTIEYKRQRDGDSYEIECDRCGSDAPVFGFDWGPPYTAKHDRPKNYLCRYCASATERDNPVVRDMARMLNELEALLSPQSRSKP